VGERLQVCSECRVFSSTICAALPPVTCAVLELRRASL
jgi:hypothetical protein